MTTLFSWTSVDSRGPSGLYIASDSRISWVDNDGVASARWDIGRKLFACTTSPDVFGYSGDVLFPSMLLSQVCSLIDKGILFLATDNPPQRAERLRALLERELNEYPAPHRRDFSVFYGTRSGERPIPYRAGTVQPSIKFHLFVIRWSVSVGWTSFEVAQPDSSAITAADGSGKNALDEHVLRWADSDVGRTSRALFSAFCDSLASGDDSKTGGAPQLVRIGPAGPAASIGIIWHDSLYLFGQRVPPEMARGAEWRNLAFEECDPDTRLRRTTAQRQPRPRGV